MTKTVFIATAEPYSGKSVIALGLVNMLLSKARKVGYFKPIIDYDPKERKDLHIDAILQYFALPIHYEDTYAYTRNEVIPLVETDGQGEIIDTIAQEWLCAYAFKIPYQGKRVSNRVGPEEYPGKCDQSDGNSGIAHTH